ncbi:MAG: Na-translocating system protein MpsC family protein [Solirubrobacteraceae bacterium]
MQVAEVRPRAREANSSGISEEQSGQADIERRPLAGGKLLAEITSRIVSLMREHHGRGPIKAKTYVLDNLIVCVLSDGFTAIERTMMEGGEPERVLQMRRDFQRVMNDRYGKMI